MTRKGGRVTADQVKTAGGPAQLIAQLVSDLVKGTHEERAAAALTLKCLTEQASIHDLKEGKRKENSELIAEAGAIPGLSEAIEIGGAGPHALAALANICLGCAKYQQQFLRDKKKVKLMQTSMLSNTLPYSLCLLKAESCFQKPWVIKAF